MLKSKSILILILFTIIPLTSKSEIINRILAIVGDKVITQYEVESFNPKRVKEIYSITDEEKKTAAIKTYYKNVLDFLVEQYTLEEIGKKYNIVVSEKEAEDAIKDIIQRNNISQKDLEEALENEGITMAQYRWQVKMDILSTRIKNRILNQLVVITEQDIRNYVDENQNSLGVSNQYELRMILLKNKSKLPDAKKAIKEKGFIAAAIEFSDDKTGKNGGYLGFIGFDHLTKDLQEKVKDAKPKDLIELETENEVRIFLVESIKDKYSLNKELREKVVAAIMDTRYKDVYKSWIDKNRTEIFIRYLSY
ncbi:MAG: SurA N-terminal domain-containing protein [Calditerrivibrio sp.]|nr:SurA N-terminal domain-containing protein [Calditerrivibrio sp.]